MSHRTTFSLDDETVESLRRLAALWGTSQAGVIRRAVRAAAQLAEPQMTPQEAIARLRSGAPMAASRLRELVEENRRERHEADEARSKG
jgi:predicted transcriptional regulator